MPKTLGQNLSEKGGSRAGESEALFLRSGGAEKIVATLQGMYVSTCELSRGQLCEHVMCLILALSRAPIGPEERTDFDRL